MPPRTTELAGTAPLVYNSGSSYDLRRTDSAGRKGVGMAEMATAQEQMDVLIRSRYSIIYVVSWEEDRVQKTLGEGLHGH